MASCQSPCGFWEGHGLELVGLTEAGWVDFKASESNGSNRSKGVELNSIKFD